MKRITEDFYRMTANRTKARLAVAAVLSIGCAAIAATRTSANYTLITESPDSGGAGFSASYANRATVEPVTGYSAATIPDATAHFLWHGFIPQLDAPLFAVADVAVGLAANTILCSPGELVTFSGSVTNQSEELAPGVVLTLSVPTNTSFVSATADQGSVVFTNGAVRYALGTIPAGGVVSYSLQVNATANGTALANASVTVEAVDGALANNSASAQSLVVTTVYSTGQAIGGWFNAANWTPAVVPTTNHRAVVDGEAVDLYTADATVAGLVLTGGSISGARRLTVTTLAEWTGGELRTYLTLVIPPGGILRVTNGSAVNLWTGSGIENRGTVRLESTALQSAFGAWVTNYGLFEVAGQRSFQRAVDDIFDFRNQAGAIFRRSSGAGTNGIVVAFGNEGRIENLTGVLDFRGTFINGGWALVNTGTLRAGAGAEIRFTRANDFREGTTFEGPGANRILAASMGPNDASQFTGAIHGDFEIAYGTMTGTFTNTGAVVWSGGNIQGPYSWTIQPGGTATLTGAGDRTLVFGYLIRNLGTLKLGGTGLNSASGGTVDNLGLLEIAGDYSVQSTVVLSNRATGVLRKSAGPGTSVITSSFYQAGGTVDLWTGTLALAGAYAPTPGSILKVVIGGTVPGAQFSRLTAAGAAALNGALVVAPMNGFVPAATDTFQIVTAASRAGTFSSFSAAPPGGGLTFQPQYLVNGVQLKMIPGLPMVDLTSLNYQSGKFQFQFRGGLGGTYVVEATAELGDTALWLPLQTNVSTGVPILFEDASAGQFPQRFYRAALR